MTIDDELIAAVPRCHHCHYTVDDAAVMLCHGCGEITCDHCGEKHGTKDIFACKECQEGFVEAWRDEEYDSMVGDYYMGARHG